LTTSSIEEEAAKVNTRDYDGSSSNITCELGMSQATGKDHVGLDS